MTNKTSFLIVWAGLCTFLLSSVLIHSSILRKERLIYVAELAAMARRYGLTDLCLTTEASHTRNPALSDLHSAFQTHPSALEHFPSGSIIVVPPRIKEAPLFKKKD